MNLSSDNSTKLKAFYDADNLFGCGKLMYQLNKRKVPYTELGRAVGVTDYKAKAIIKDYKDNAEQNKKSNDEEKSTAIELARIEKVAAQNGQFADAMKLHIRKGFDKHVDEFNLEYEITLIEVVGAFFRVGINANCKDGKTSNHFIEYVNFDIDFEPLVKLWAAVLGTDFITA